MTHCGCKVKIEKNLSGYMKIPEIVYCPLHLAAPELLNMVEHYELDLVEENKRPAALRLVRELIAKASPIERKEP